jgi:hypothetical protein
MIYRIRRNKYNWLVAEKRGGLWPFWRNAGLGCFITMDKMLEAIAQDQLPKGREPQEIDGEYSVVVNPGMLVRVPPAPAQSRE